jgi:phage FluMu protein gp41
MQNDGLKVEIENEHGNIDADESVCEVNIAHPIKLDDKHGHVIAGELLHGLKIGSRVEKSFLIREALAGDMFFAEDQVTIDKPLAFSAAMMGAQLIKLGSTEGPFRLTELKRLKPEDYALLRKAQEALEKQGESLPHGEPKA